MILKSSGTYSSRIGSDSCTLSSTILESLADRFPFSEKELEQLVKCYETKFKGQEIHPLSALSGPAKSFEDDIIVEELEDLHQNIRASSSFNQDTGIFKTSSNDLFNSTDGGYLDAPILEEETILVKLASSAHVLFSMEDALRRVRFTQEKILPWTFTETINKVMNESFYVSSYGLEEVEEDLIHFLENMAVCTGRRGPRQVIDILYDSCVAHNQANATELIRMCYLLALASHVLSDASTNMSSLSMTALLEHALEPPPQLLASLIESVRKPAASNESGPVFQFEEHGGGLHDNESHSLTIVSRTQFRNWVDETAPMLASTLPTFFHDLLFLGEPFPKKGMTPFRSANIRHFSAFFSPSRSLNICPLSFCLGTVAPEFCRQFYQLYSLDTSGACFSMLCKSIIGYDGPVVILCAAEGGGIFGAYTRSQLKQSGEYYGDYESFLFRIDPCVNIYRATGNNTNFVYLNPSTRLKCDGKAHGLGFGGNHYAPRLFIPESFVDDFCRAGSFDMTFEQGPLLPGDWQLADRFKLRHLEVWGVGEPSVVEEALLAQEQKRRIDDASLRRAQLVDKRAFVDDLWSYGNSNLFAHRQQARGRAEFKVNDGGHDGYSIDRDAQDSRASIRDLSNTGLLEDLPSSPRRTALGSAFD